MKKIACIISIVSCFVVYLPGFALAGETGHYINGVEGIKAASVPPPGLYYRMYNVLYHAGRLKDRVGNKLDIKFDLSVFAVANRVVWVTGHKVLGADYFMDATVPVVKTYINIGGLNDERTGFGDINIEPVGLSWHGKRHDASFGVSMYLPTGEYNVSKPASPGKDFYTLMFTFGWTSYLDPSRTWSASILGRYEIHSEMDDIHIRPGNDFHFEWGIGKTIARIFDVGLSGYCQWQVTDDSGSDLPWDKDIHDRVFALGPEMTSFIPSAKLFLSMRVLKEFGAVDRPQGNVATLTITKIF